MSSSGSLFEADAGILLHPTSLPGPYGVGDLGPLAHAWVERLAAAGQNLWQVLPLGPTGYGSSPYQGTSAFAGNTLLVSPDGLVDVGLLSADELRARRLPQTAPADFDAAYRNKREIFGIAFERFIALDATAPLRREFEAFLERESEWLQDYALYVALKGSFDERAWTDWPDAYRDRDPVSLEQFRRERADDVRRVEFRQFLFDHQWRELAAFARDRGIRIVGDLPIFVAQDSADVWAHRELFQLDETGHPTVVAGVPPDYFSETGQLWGNPLYDWERHQQDGFAWWHARLEKILRWVDVVRVDHFRGFVGYWEIPAEDETAANGRWVSAPGRELFESLAQVYPRPMPVIAEDLGVITDEVIALRDDFGLPGIRLFQFAFGDEETSAIFLPENYDPNCVAYTGTHDNDTMIGWLHSVAGEDTTLTADAMAEEQKRALEYLGTSGEQIHWDSIEALLRSQAGAIIVPLQDVLGLGSEARMNVPGRLEGNWGWRLESFDAVDAALKRLAQITRAAGRGRAM